MTPKMLKIIPCALMLALISGCSDSTTNPLDETVIDTVAPAVPANLGLEAYRGTNPYLRVLWESNAEADLAGYIVQSSLDQGTTWTDASALITTNEFVDSYHQEIWYRVSAVDLSENQSAQSGAVTYRAPTNGPPKFATNRKGQDL